VPDVRRELASIQGKADIPNAYGPVALCGLACNGRRTRYILYHHRGNARTRAH
jgi:hypothetical protein